MRWTTDPLIEEWIEEQIEKLMEDMLAFGMRYEVAERAAPFLWPLFDQEGNLKETGAFAEALRQQAPRLAERIGLARRH